MQWLSYRIGSHLQVPHHSLDAPSTGPGSGMSCDFVCRRALLLIARRRSISRQFARLQWSRLLSKLDLWSETEEAINTNMKTVLIIAIKKTPLREALCWKCDTTSISRGRSPINGRHQQHLVPFFPCNSCRAHLKYHNQGDMVSRYTPPLPFGSAAKMSVAHGLPWPIPWSPMTHAVVSYIWHILWSPMTHPVVSYDPKFGLVSRGHARSK